GTDGSIYLQTFGCGAPTKFSAVNPDGTQKWETVQQYGIDRSIFGQTPVFNSEMSTAYFYGTKFSFGGPIGNTTSYSTSNGSLLADTPCDSRGFLLAFGPWQSV